jgi:hypothetical protein
MGMNAISLGVKPVYDWFTAIQKTLKGWKACTAISQQWATSSWLSPLKATFKTLQNTVGLEELGITVAYRSELLVELKVGSPEVDLQDARARSFFSYVSAIVEENASSMVWWTDHHPGKLSGLFAEATEVATLTAFKLDCDAWWYAKVSIY